MNIAIVANEGWATLDLVAWALTTLAAPVRLQASGDLKTIVGGQLLLMLFLSRHPYKLFCNSQRNYQFFLQYGV